MNIGSVEQIDILLKADCPLLFVVSHEEQRVERFLEALVAQNKKKPVWKWSATQGAWCDHTTSSGGHNMREKKEDLQGDPLGMIDFISSSGQGMFILRDFAHYLDQSSGYIVQRQLRDVVEYSLTPGSTIVIIDSVFEIPSRLEKLVSVVDFDLPSKEELAHTAKYLLENFPETRSISEEGKDKLLQIGSEAALGLTLNETESVFAKSLAMTRTVDPRVIINEKKHIIRKSGVLQYYDVSTDMSAVGGLGNLKGWLQQRGRAFSDEAKAYGLPSPKGVLIVGIPGTGKSLISKCIGREWNMPVLRMDVGSLFGSLVGQSEANMRKALKTAEAMAPCVLWIDELEKSLGGSGDLDGGTSSRVFGSFLSWMQEKESPVFVVATANDVSALPPEMLRKGRFDELFFVDLPTKEEREEILKIHINKYKRDPKDFDLDALVSVTDGFSGAEIEQVVVESLFISFNDEREPHTDDLKKSSLNTVPLSKTMAKKIEVLRKWADGRAVFAGCDSVDQEEATPGRKRREVTASKWDDLETRIRGK